MGFYRIIGPLPILTLDSVNRITPTGSTVILDHLDNDVFVSKKSDPQIQNKLEFLRNIGEPMITGFNPSTLAEALANARFRLEENMILENIERRYF